MIYDFNYFIPKDNTLDELLKIDLDNISTIDLIKRISKLSKDDRKKAFETEKIIIKLREGILNDGKENKDQYRSYREVMNYLSPSEVLSLYDSYYLRKFFSDTSNGYEYILFVCLCEKDLNETVRYILSDDKLFHEFFKNNNNFYSIFYNLEYELLRDCIFKIEQSKESYNYIFISSCSSENQKKLLNENLNDSTIIKMLGYLKVEVLNDFFQNDKRAEGLIPRINIISYIKEGVVFSDEIISKKEIFDRLKSSSFVTFRKNINAIEKNNNPLIIEKRLKKYYEELLSSYDPESKIFIEYKKFIADPHIGLSDFNDFIVSDDLVKNLRSILKKNNNPSNKEEIITMLKELTSKKITEIVIDALFQDNYYNVCLNINEMIRYNETLPDDIKVLDKEKLLFYKLILNFDNIDSDTKIEIYNKLKNKNYNLIFYEDLRKLKDLSYKRIKDDMLKLKEHSEYLDIESSKKHGVSIYNLKDKEYFLLVRRMGRFYSDSSYERGCYSLISNENNETYGYDHNYGFLYGFDEFDNDTILHVLESDAYSMSSKEKSSNYVNRIMTAREIVNSDDWYSEIQIVNKKSINNSSRYQALKPSYLVVYDDIGEEEYQETIEEAKRLRIPIVIINKKTLKKESETNIHLDRNYDVYVSDYITEELKKDRR